MSFRGLHERPEAVVTYLPNLSLVPAQPNDYLDLLCHNVYELIQLRSQLAEPAGGS